MEGKCETI